uniref:Adhesion G protein-coupled receptor D2 n=1 Tax=Cynoglossus semilaevis TaxID=244447 RepID=A0A3P8WH95_CYNSE
MNGVLDTGFALFFLMMVCKNEPTYTWADRVGDSHGTSKLVHLVSNTAFQLVNTSVAFSEAESFCRGQFSSLASMDLEEEYNGAQELLQLTQFHTPIWVRNPQKASTNPLDLSKNYLLFPAIHFPKESREGFARVNLSFPALSSVSVCVRVQWDIEWTEVSTIFSYASPVFTNEFQLRGQVDMQEHILLALIIHGKHLPYKASFQNDGMWHHICVTWHRRSGDWAIYVDGIKKDMGSDTDNSRDILGDGIFILGQDQDSFGGNFTEPFYGAITDLNVWNMSLDTRHVTTLNVCLAINEEPLFSWSPKHLSSHPVIKEVQAQLFCPERYLKMKQLRDSQDSQPTAFMNKIMKISNITQPVIVQHSSSLSSLAHASALLDISVQALEDSQQEELQPTDMVSLIQLLSMAADVPTGQHHSVDATNQSREGLHEMSKDYIKVADSIISQDSVVKWQAIREVVNGPMDVVKNIDHFVARLSPVLMAETDHLTIHSHNIKLQVQQQSLQKGFTISGFCGPTTELSSLDCISVPHQKILDLQNNGFQKFTLVNTWYGSLRPPVTPKDNISMTPTVTDGSQRYLGTIMGSSVISTTALCDDQPVSMAVRFQLKHRAQSRAGIVYDPICAFWDFDLIPESGGWWNTKGCEVVSKESGFTVCYCNHTTNFALLLQVFETQRSPENENILQVLTFIGCGVSLCGLLFTFIIFIVVGVPKSDRTTVHKNLIISLGIAELLLMCSDWASASEGACFMVTALLHLFFMSSFSWMLVEGLLLWSKVVSVNINDDHRMKIYYIIGWGLPVLIVGVTLAVSVEKYKADNHCWLNVKTNTIWAFVGPVIFVMTINAVVLCRVVMVTVSSARRRAKMLTPSLSSKFQTFDLTWAIARPLLILLPVLGLTWLCGVLVHLSVVVAYVFIALNAFQGMFIFLVYAVYNSEVRRHSAYCQRHCLLLMKHIIRTHLFYM